MTNRCKNTNELKTFLKICLLCSQCFILAASSGSFLTAPTSKSVYEGTVALFECTLSFQSFQTLEWYDDSQTQIMPSSRYIITSNQDETLDINYIWLKIKPVQTTDDGKGFYCVVVEDSVHKFKSNRATLNVTKVPQTESPECKRLEVNYNEGDQVELVCEQENTNPRVNLAIYKDNKLLTGTSQKTQEKYKYIAKFVARRTDDGSVLTCVQTSPTDNYPSIFNKNCSYGNINVNYAPSVSINGAYEVILRKQQELVYVCTSKQAKPSPVTFRWSVDFAEDSTVRFFEEHDGNTLRLILSPSTIIHEVNLTCIGRNTMGSSRVSHVLRVIHDPVVTSNPTYATGNPAGTAFNWSTALILAVTGSCGLCIALFTAVIIGFYHFQLPQSMDIYGERIAQPEVYFEPKDGISSPQVIDGKHSIGVQVSELTEIESVYTEVSEYGIKKGKDQALPENNSYSHV
ncbi:uncharacterized protein [Antedon mediterranea]|uniref:uncharacterized protein n=1 Tax=Antedon mediterranea TaxID=105859 RepID=UPI003AF82421